jgi:hypothetical protein
MHFKRIYVDSVYLKMSMNKNLLNSQVWRLTIISVFTCACLLIILWLMGIPIKNAEKEYERLSAELQHEQNPFAFRHKKAVLLKSLEENGQRMEKRIEFTKAFIIVIEVIISINLIWLGYMFLLWLKES